MEGGNRTNGEDPVHRMKGRSSRGGEKNKSLRGSPIPKTILKSQKELEKLDQRTDEVFFRNGKKTGNNRKIEEKWVDSQ